MVRDDLRSASEHLRAASSAAAGETSERLSGQAEDFERHATADRGPDHGRLARHESILTTIADEEDGEVADHVEAALADIRAYRETVEGV